MKIVLPERWPNCAGANSRPGSPIWGHAAVHERVVSAGVRVGHPWLSPPPSGCFRAL